MGKSKKAAGKSRKRIKKRTKKAKKASPAPKTTTSEVDELTGVEQARPTDEKVQTPQQSSPKPSEPGRSPLQFEPFSSAVDVGFWHTLSQNKLDVYKLDSRARPLLVAYTNSSSHHVPAQAVVGPFSLEPDNPQVPSRHAAAKGSVLNANTAHAFKQLDKAKLLQEQGQLIWRDIHSGAVEKDPSLLSRVLLLTFADLKHHHFFYWFGFPALSSVTQAQCLSVDSLQNTFSPVQVRSLLSQYRNAPQPFFLVTKQRENGKGDKDGGGEREEEQQRSDEGGVRFLPLSAYHTVCQDSAQTEVMIGFLDPSAQPQHPGWPLRNLLALVGCKWGLEHVRVVCFRDVNAALSLTDSTEVVKTSSIVLSLALNCKEKSPEASVAIVGFERNQRQKLGPRLMDLNPLMDPAKLAEASADLNIKLMRWRALPGLKMEQLAQWRCLLLGAGTLGCNVARTLMGWGVRKISFVDNGKVSYSNPVRQTLYNLEDCLKGGRPKALAAAENLRRIFPGMLSRGHVLSIPMPGHFVTDKMLASTKQSISALEQLIAEHDAVFLLTDSREARWLPSVICASQGKPLLNAALGFDTFVIMRHGILDYTEGPESNKTETETEQGQGQEKTETETAEEGKEPEKKETIETQTEGRKQETETETEGEKAPVRKEETEGETESKEDTETGTEGGQGQGKTQYNDLGCYFCNDVVAPRDSLTDRTLDQQCTVTRPSLSFIASALVAELAVASLHHPEGAAAPAEGREDLARSRFGVLPHQLRGSLPRFDINVVSGKAFPHCTACSRMVIKAYRERGIDFVLDVLNDGTGAFLENLTGLTKLQEEAQRQLLEMEAIEWDDSDEDGLQ